MKKTVIISLLMLMLSAAAYPQNNHVCQPDTILVYTNHSIIEGDSLLLFNAYDADGLFTQCKKHYHNGWIKGKPKQAIPPIQNQTDYEYDLNHNMVKMTYEVFSVPRPGRYESYFAYQDGRQSLYTRQYIDFLGDTHSCDSVTHRYDAMGRIQEEIAYQASGETLVFSKHSVYEYDADKVVLTTEGLINGTWGDWLQLSIETKTYNEEGLLSNIVSESYNKPTNSRTYSYDTEGRVSSILTKVLDSLDWVNHTLLEYSYDGNGHLTLAEIKSWQEGEFVNANRAVYELNETGYPTVVTFEKWDGEEWIQGNWQSGFYIFPQDHLKRQNDFICRRDAERIEIHYAVTPMPDYDVEEHHDDLAFCSIYPNPAQSELHLSYSPDVQPARIELYDLQGRLLQTQTQSLESIGLEGLAAGQYLMKVTLNNGKTFTDKVVKE